MATIAQSQDEEDNKQNPAGGPVTVGNTGGGQSGTQGQGGASTPVSSVQQNAAPQNNQGYTDVASYLNANQGGSSQLGQQVSQNLTNKYNTTKSGIDTSYNQFAGDVNKGYVPENTDLINQVAANPTAAAADKNQLSAFQGQLNDTYTGPSSWADAGTQQGNVNQATQYGNLNKTPGGLNVLAQEVEGQTGGNQSQGINQLDTLLLGGSPTATSQIQAAADPYKNLNDYINQQNMAAGQAVTNAQNTAQQTSQDALNAFTGANGTLTNLNNTVNKTAADKLAAAQGTNSQLLKDLQNLYGGQALDTSASTQSGAYGRPTQTYNTTDYTVGQLSPQDLQALGVTQDQWNQLQGSLQNIGASHWDTKNRAGVFTPTTQLDISQYLSQQDPSQAINASTTATPEQYAQMSAIQQLLGGKTPQGSALNPALASLAGTAPANFNTFNYNQATSDAQQIKDAEWQAAQQLANQESGQANAYHDANDHSGFGGWMNSLPVNVQTALKAFVNPLTAVKPEIQEAQKRI